MSKIKPQVKYYRKQKENGICASCTKKSVNNTVFCEEHLLFQRNYQKQYRLKKKQRGECTWSGCKIKTTRAYCQFHLSELQRRQPNKHRQGITDFEFEQMVENQNGVCAICNKNCKLCLDHDHGTGAIRGLLCNSCNCGLGFFKDNKTFLESAIYYLNNHSESAK